VGLVNGGPASLWDAFAAAATSPAVLAVAAVVLAFAALVAALLLVVRRGRHDDAREIVRLLEEMRSGRTRGRVELDARSPLAGIADSANRLAQDLAIRLSRAETASEGFRALQDAARGYAVVTTDADGDLRGVSAGASQLFGWEEDAILSRNASLLFDEASWRELLPKLARKSLRDRGVETRALMARRDGTRFHGRVHVRTLCGPADEATGFLLVVHDVSDEVRIEGELRAAEARSRKMLDGLPVGVALVEGGRVVAANAAVRSILSLETHDVPGLRLSGRIATEDVLVVEDALRRLEGAPEGDAEEASVALLDPAGRRGREVRFVAVAHRHEDRPAVLLTLRDETDERRFGRALRASEARLDAVLEESSDAIVLIADEPAGPRVRFVNRAFCDLTGLSRGTILGARARELSRALAGVGEGGAAVDACLGAALDGTADDTVTWDGGKRVTALHAAPIGSRESETRGRLLVARDITAQTTLEQTLEGNAQSFRRRAEGLEVSYAELRSLHDDLESRRAEAERLNQELKTLDVMKSDLLANVSHELQTPLVSIRGYTEMILKGRLGAVNDEQKKGLALSLKNIDRLIAMIDNLLAFARMDRDPGTMRLTSFPLDGVVDEALLLVQERLLAKRIEVVRDLEEPGTRIRADRDKILQVFLNLLSNAIKFNREGGTAEIAARKGKPGFVLVQVHDTGVGIAKEDLDRIFDRFYQVPTRGTPPQEGTGIGLAIVRNILRLHGCVIHASSEVGGGSTFSFTLPLADSRTGQGDPIEERATRPVEVAPPPAAAAVPPPAPAPAAEERPPEAQGARPRLRIIRRG
jgi:PAS domain S-box-containing protein